MGCGGPTDVQDEYIAALMVSTEIARESDRLTICGPDSHIRSGCTRADGQDGGS